MRNDKRRNFEYEEEKKRAKRVKLLVNTTGILLTLEFSNYV